MIAAEFNSVSKRYKTTVALDDLSLSVPEGAIFGLVGQNGAGKSTAIRILLGLIRASSGSVSLFGGAGHKRVSFLPDVPGFYGWMTARQYLEFVAGVHGGPKTEQRSRIDALLHLANLTDIKTPIGGYSRGMKQRLGIAQALVTAPDLLVLDEPTSALDPIGRLDVLNLMMELRGRTTILFSSHILEDVERVADQFAILHRAHLIANGTLAQIRVTAGITPHLEIEILGDPSTFASVVDQQSWANGVEVKGTTVEIRTINAELAMFQLPRIATDLECGIARFANVEPSLEDAFVALTRGTS
ncbi:MAG: ABC transporter ATP-binding protein [Thermomicrobiales bacterium]|nr:ABC transporter ATP-binding protein [Thermomicrobiales bacterium]MCO5219464.1 ABC transporter ATP-binding protein [Thermomicrobiales bacterium]MCO5226262.1 ABC transporter ATP-binding protein [Thermomicrobiales bacterium]MCO5228436.1 ABC transporter ATP-binding protein [Thermomicrobiales bacterium]